MLELVLVNSYAAYTLSYKPRSGERQRRLPPVPPWGVEHVRVAGDDVAPHRGFSSSLSSEALLAGYGLAVDEGILLYRH